MAASPAPILGHNLGAAMRAYILTGTVVGLFVAIYLSGIWVREAQ